MSHMQVLETTEGNNYHCSGKKISGKAEIFCQQEGEQITRVREEEGHSERIRIFKF